MALWVQRFDLLFASKMQMNHLSGKKRKKIPKLSKNHLFLGIPANIAAGQLDFRAELNIDPKGKRSRPYRGWK